VTLMPKNFEISLVIQRWLSEALVERCIGGLHRTRLAGSRKPVEAPCPTRSA